MPKPSINIDECHFFHENIVHLDAGMIGISRGNWVVLSIESASQEAAAKLMQKNRFDVLPIISGEQVTGYFQTFRWNDYSSPNRKSLSYKDVIPLQTNVRDLIKNFATDHRLFYFLSNENRIAGLVTVADLNSRQVKTYLYSLFCELEIELGNLISAAHLLEDKSLIMTFSERNYEQAKESFEKDRKNGVETSFMEYLYLSNLIDIIVTKRLNSKLGYPGSEFKEKLCSLNKLRNMVDHPNRSIITRASTVKSLWTRIDWIEDVVFRLRQETGCVVSR